ncbi:MAG: DUF4405 domain-containing protein [bacterium]
MTNSRKNFIVDLLAYVGFVFLIGTGLILKYILPHGSGRVVGGGTGHLSAEKLITTLWGLTRDQWGQIHFWIAVVILASLLLHLVLHWKWITCMLGGRKRPDDANGGRAALGIAGMFGILALILLPFLTPTDVATRGQLLELGETQNLPVSEDVAEPGTHGTEIHDESIVGSMSLIQVQKKTGIPYTYILKELGLSEQISPDTKLGQLRKTHGFSMEDVRMIVSQYKP